MAGLATVLVSFTLVQKGGDAQEKKKTRHIKMMKMENGKKMELDTVLTGDDVFVWNGDTINPPKHLKKVSPSGFDKMQQVDVKVDRNNRNENVLIIKRKDGKDGEPMIWQTAPDHDIEILTEDADSTGTRTIVRKIMKDSDGNNLMYFNHDNMKHFPPVPPPPPAPPVPHRGMMKIQRSGQMINLNDPNIISFSKKELSGNREKIEIIRKKAEGSDFDEAFDFEFNEPVILPYAPEEPMMIRDLKDGGNETRIIRKEKKVAGKGEKEIEIEVETKEEK